MVTNYPQQLTATAEVTRESTDGLAAKTLGRLGQFVCGLRGHDAVLHFEGNRVNMRWTSCGHDTPGWEISGKGPRPRGMQMCPLSGTLVFGKVQGADPRFANGAMLIRGVIGVVKSGLLGAGVPSGGAPGTNP